MCPLYFTECIRLRVPYDIMSMQILQIFQCLLNTEHFKPTKNTFITLKDLIKAAGNFVVIIR